MIFTNSPNSMKLKIGGAKIESCGFHTTFKNKLYTYENK
jgi:hypothetical protein